MSDSQVIARKFRPQSLDEVVGQEAIRRTIENSIKSGRIHHAYLFAGARGVGKTTTARILAKCLNCVQGPTAEPCGVCASCVEISASRSIDVMEIDAASNTGVDNVRDVIINTVQISPARDRNKIFIIDEVHMLSKPAFNALLKTLEEPPSGVVFIMATTELHKVPETILSRCQVFEFRTITLKKIFDQLKRITEIEGVQISEAALLSVARAGEGSMRDAESALDQVISFAGKVVKDEDVSLALGLVDLETLHQTMQAIGEQDAERLLRLVDEIVARGYDLRNFSRELMTHIRALLVVKISGFDAELVQMPAGEGEALTRLAALFSEQDLIRFFSVLTKTEQDIRVSSQPRFQLEIGLMKLLHARRLYLLEDALQQVNELVAQLGGGISGAGSLSRGSGSSGSAPPSRGGGSSSRPPSTSSPSSSRSAPSAMTAMTPMTEDRPFQRAMSEASARTNPSQPAASHAATRASAATTAPSDEAAPSPPVAPFESRTPPAPTIKPVSKPANATAPPWEDDAPPAFEEPYEVLHSLPPSLPDEAREPGGGVQDMVGRLKAALLEKKKMMLISALNKADSIKVDGDHLRVAFATANAGFKNQVDTRDNRKLIEETCRELIGRRIMLAVTVGAQGTQQGATETGDNRPKEVNAAKYLGENHPKLRAITQKFQGQVIEIVKPESND